MSINTDFYNPRKKVYADEAKTVELCEVRGITPDDIAQIVCEHASEVEKLMGALEKDERLGGGSISGALEALPASSFSSLLASVPAMAAKVIALAADEPTMSGHVRKNFLLPQQFKVLTEIAKLTFIDKNGFKEFLGNAMALVGSDAGTTKRHPEQSPSTSGSIG